MKRWVFLSLLFLPFAFSADGQTTRTKGLVLTGTIIDLKAVAECSGTDGRILVRAELAMQFRNDTNRPLIIFKPNSRWFDVFRKELGSTRVNFLRSLPSLSDKESGWVQAINARTDNCRPSNYTIYRSESLISTFIKRIDFPEPTSDFFEVIEPGGYYTFGEFVTLDTGFEVEVSLGKRLSEARIRSELPAFQIEYHLSLKENAKGEGLFRTLQTRWKNYGDLVLDDNGDFTVTSEPIINRTAG